MTPQDNEKNLALAYVPATARPAVAALWALDERLIDIAVGAREAMLGRIRLAWWRDRLLALGEAPVPGEPIMTALAPFVATGAIAPDALGDLAEAAALVAGREPIDAEDLRSYAERRGVALFRGTARLLDGLAANVDEAGRRWALADLWIHAENRETAAAAHSLAKEAFGGKSGGLPRPLAVLKAIAELDLKLGRRELRRQGSPRRMMRIIWAGMTGR